MNANGVRLFDSSEVNELARDVATAGRALDDDTIEALDALVTLLDEG